MFLGQRQAEVSYNLLSLAGVKPRSEACVAADGPPLQLRERRLQSDQPVSGSPRSDPKRAMEFLPVKEDKNLCHTTVNDRSIISTSIF